MKGMVQRHRLRRALVDSAAAPLGKYRLMSGCTSDIGWRPVTVTTWEADGWLMNSTSGNRSDG